MALHGRPFPIKNAVDTGVAQRPVLSQLMLTKYAVQPRPQPLDGSTTLTVEGMSPKFNGNGLQSLERMRQQQQLAFGIQARTLNAASIPSGAYLDTPVPRIDVHVCRHPDRLLDRLVDHGKREH